MRGYTELEVFKREEIDGYLAASSLIESGIEQEPWRRPGRLKPTKPGAWYRCHELVRAIFPFIPGPWTIVDGLYDSCGHSWFESAVPERRFVILDVYAIASMPMVQLRAANTALYRDLYRGGKPRPDLREEVIESLREEMRLSIMHKFLDHDAIESVIDAARRNFDEGRGVR